MAECVHLVRTSSYFDGALPPAEEAEAVEHLAGCDACQALLRDAATLDAVISQAPPRAQIQPRRRRWPIAIAAIGVAAAAAVALWLAVPRGPGGGPEVATEVAIALPKARAIEARFTGDHLGAYRPYDPLRGDRAHEAIALDTLAELERRGDAPDLIAALAATGDLARAGELAARRPADDAAAEADRAALALAAGATDDAFVHAYRAVDRAPALAAGWWNLALAARTAGLWHVSRAAFAKVADRAEPGWSDEARRQIATLDRQLAGDDAELDAYLQRARAMLDRGAPITVDDVRRFPALARIHVLDALRLCGGWNVVPLQAVAEAIDHQTGGSELAAALVRARDAEPVVRAKFVTDYRAVLARTATPAELAALLANLRAAGHAVDDLRVGVILHAGLAVERLGELRELVRPWHDTGFDLAVRRAELRLALPPGDDRTEAALTAMLATCPAAWPMQCGQLAYDLADWLRAWGGRERDAERWAQQALERYRAAVSPADVRAARELLSGLHAKLGRAGLARAEADEVARSPARPPTDDAR